MREAFGWLAAAILLGVALAGLLILLVAPAHAQQARPYTVYRVPLGCLYLAGNDRSGMAMVFVADQDEKPCDGALKGVK